MPPPHEPRFRILVNGRDDITATVADRLLALSVTDEAGRQSDTAEIRLDDRDSRIRLPPEGAVLEIALGWAPLDPVVMGRYTVGETGLEGPPDALVIRAQAADMLAGLKEFRTRSWDDVSIGDIVAGIAADHGLEARVGESLRGLRIPHLDQTDESDLHLLTRLAQDYDAVAKPAGGRLLFVAQGQAASASGQAMPVVRVTRQQLRSWRVTRSGRPRYGSVRANWHDAGAAERRTERAGSSEPAYILRRLYASAEEARNAAAAKLAELSRETRRLSAAFVRGDPSLAAEAGIEMTGFRPGIDGRWTCSRVVHRLDRNGYTTTADADFKGD